MTAIATGTLTGVQFFSAATPDGSWKRALAWCAALARGHRDRVLPASAVREFTLLSHPPASLAYLGHTASGLALVLADGQVYPLTRHALTHVAAMTSVPLALVESLIARGSRAIAALLTEQWHVVRQPSLVRVRVDCEAVRAIVSDEYGPMDLLPLLRTMEATWRARDLAPVRALHRADITRLEFAVFVRAARQASPYTPGIILENSEVADRAVVLDAAMIGRRRYGTSVPSPARVELRHTRHAPDRVAERLGAATEPLLASAASAIAKWDALRNVPLAPSIVAQAERWLTDTLGARAGRAVHAAWATDPAAPNDAPRTPAQLLRHVRAVLPSTDVADERSVDALLALLFTNVDASDCIASPLARRVLPRAAAAPASGSPAW